ncbi:MAG: ParB N-terminal domain-containing protein, partial [Planctomycetaceae bacterium]|nr:ParB N-terminal domain-containing protein [Planctomycetaceae bacterium]
MAHSTRARSGAKSPAEKSPPGDGYTRTTPKPKKPRFPLWQHAGTGQWAKKVRGKHYYFGTDKDAALKEYMRVKDDLEAGRVPRPAEDDSSRVTLTRLANIFLTHKTHQVQTGELQSRSFDHYYATCEGLLEHFGKTVFVDQIRPDDLLTFRHKLGETRNATSLANEITRVRSVFRFAFENGLIDRPVRYGEFKRPSKSVIRRARTARGARLFEPAQLRKILKKANDQLRAMVLLGLNAGFGPGDITTLPLSAVDLETGWVSYARPKTGIERRCPLWNETIKALRVVRQKRKEPRDPSHSDRFFITQRREPWASNSSGATGIGHEFRKVLDTLKLYRTGLSFYVLRHCFQTIGDETGDYLAVRRIMGHADNSISDAYRERFPDERLKKVTDHVHDWLYGEGGRDGEEETHQATGVDAGGCRSRHLSGHPSPAGQRDGIEDILAEALPLREEKDMAKVTTTRSKPIDAIEIGDRTRKDLGDIEALAASIKEVGLLQPVVVDADHKLIAGRRRIEACKQLGWKSIPTVVAESVDSLLKMAQAESDENTCRKDFTPEEAVRMGTRIEGAISKIKREAQRDGGKKAGRGRPKQE